MMKLKSMPQCVYNYLLRAKLAAAYKKGDMNTVNKLSARVDAQQLALVRKALKEQQRKPAAR